MANKVLTASIAQNALTLKFRGKLMNLESDNISHTDRMVLQKLAGKVAELANKPVEAEKRKLWYEHNSLKSTRPVIFCDPHNAWNEIIKDKDLKCTGGLARTWEVWLRKDIFQGEYLCDDKTIEPCFDIRSSFYESDWGLDVKTFPSRIDSSITWDPPLKSYDDMEKLKFPEIIVDHEKNDRLVSIANEVLGDYLTVRLKGKWWVTLGMTLALAHLRGLDKIMLDIYRHPDELKQLMAFIRAGTLAKLDFLEKQNLLSLNNDGSIVGSRGLGWTTELPRGDFNNNKVRTLDMWGFCESQETATWSPDAFAEFIFPFQIDILDRFGLNCYGCCEPLHQRFEIIKNAPRLRRISVSAWSNLKIMADNIKNNYVLSLKPNPIDWVVPQLNEEIIRKTIKEAVRICKNCHLEIVMTDTQTLGNRPQNIIRWCEIVREIVDNL